MYSFLFLFLFSCVLLEDKTQGCYCWYWEKQSFGYDLCFHSLWNPLAHWLQWCWMWRRYLSITQGFKSMKPRFFTHTNFNIVLHFLFEKHEYRDIQKHKSRGKKRRNSVFKGKHSSGVNLFNRFLIYEHVRI